MQSHNIALHLQETQGLPEAVTCAIQGHITFADGQPREPRMGELSAGWTVIDDAGSAPGSGLHKRSIDLTATLSKGLGPAAGYAPSALSNVRPRMSYVVNMFHISDMFDAVVSQDIHHVQGTAVKFVGLQMPCSSHCRSPLPRAPTIQRIYLIATLRPFALNS